MAAAYEVTSVTEDQIQDPNGGLDLVDVFDITFTIPNRPGQFTVQVQLGGNTVNDAYTVISEKVTEVNAIYAGSSGTSGS